NRQRRIVAQFKSVRHKIKRDIGSLHRQVDVDYALRLTLLQQQPHFVDSGLFRLRREREPRLVRRQSFRSAQDRKLHLGVGPLNANLRRLAQRRKRRIDQLGQKQRLARQIAALQAMRDDDTLFRNDNLVADGIKKSTQLRNQPALLVDEAAALL